MPREDEQKSATSTDAREPETDAQPRSVVASPPSGDTPVRSVARTIAAAAESVSGPLAAAAESVSGPLAAVVGTVSRPVESVARPVESVARPVVAGAVRRWRESTAGRTSRLREQGKQPLRSLWEEHPEVRQARPRELGLQTVPLDEICGTAVGGAAQRGGDFLPLPDRRGSNWLGRWQRIRRAVDRLEILPPVDLVLYGDCYWVVDGHNRVAAALYAGQVAIDAAVVELRPLGAPGRGGTPSLADVAAEGRDVRALGEGRFSRTATPHIHLEQELRSGADRRSGRDRRVTDTTPAAERRSGQDRRSGEDRRTEGKGRYSPP